MRAQCYGGGFMFCRRFGVSGAGCLCLVFLVVYLFRAPPAPKRQEHRTPAGSKHLKAQALRAKGIWAPPQFFLTLFPLASCPLPLISPLSFSPLASRLFSAISRLSSLVFCLFSLVSSLPCLSSTHPSLSPLLSPPSSFPFSLASRPPPLLSRLSSLLSRLFPLVSRLSSLVLLSSFSSLISRPRLMSLATARAVVAVAAAAVAAPRGVPCLSLSSPRGAR